MPIRVDAIEDVFPIADFIADSFGRSAEVVVHDAMDLEASIVYIRNGELSGRKVGDCATDRALKLIRDNRAADVEYVSNYAGKSLEQRDFRCSTMFVRNRENRLVGLLCININITGLNSAIELLEAVLHGGGSAREAVSGATLNAAPQSTFEGVLQGDPRETVRQIVRRVLAGFPTAIERMSKAERLTALKAIDEEGVFLMKGAVSIVAEELSVSVPTIYKYLRELQVD